jgi:two-component system, sensor histidine kinase and response regulator
VERTRNAGIVAYLTKPVRVALLWDALNLALTHESPRELMEPCIDVGRDPQPALTPSDGRVRDTDGSRDRLVTTDSRHPLPGSPVLLLVEDNVINQNVGVAMLNDLGYRVDVAADGTKALEVLESRDDDYYSAVLMDCQMPFMDGYETTEKIRQGEAAGRHVLVIAVTASAMAADRERCLDAGMDDYLTKPLRLEALRAMLNRWELDGSPHIAAHDEAEELSAALDDADESTGTPPPVLDAQVLGNLSRLGREAGVDLVGQLVALFLVDADARVAAMRQALVARDPMAVVRSAHALRGSSANIGATDLAWVCEALELNEGAEEPQSAGSCGPV